MAVAVSVLFPAWLLAQHQTEVLDEPVVGGVIPYQVEIREISLLPAVTPNIHSVVAGDWNGQWVILAGRTNGLHGLTGMAAFDPAYENREIWVIDPAGKQSWHKSLETSAASGLTQDQVDSLSSVNAEFYQDGETLLIAGGYGFKRSVSDHVTYDTLTAVHLPGMVAWVKEPAGSETSMASDHVDQIIDNYFQVTGGGLERTGVEYQLIFGQNYAGRYRPNFNGIYRKQVRRFRVDLSNGLVIPDATKESTPQDEAFRRRDLNVATMLQRGAEPDTFEEVAVALSGVFTPEGGVFTVPVVIEAGGKVTMQDPAASTTMKQALQVYHCAEAGLYHRATDEMHLLLFGGLTIQEYDRVNESWLIDNNAPFTNQCSVVVRNKDGNFRQYLLPVRFPEILVDGKELRFGTNAEFFYQAEVPRLHPQVIDLAEIREPTVIGHIFGGLVADAGNGGNTGSSGRVFEVLLIPNLPDATPAITKSGEELALAWKSDAHACYLIEHSEALSGWAEFLPAVPGNGGIIQWSETRSDSRQFYRLLGGWVTREPSEPPGGLVREADHTE